MTECTGANLIFLISQPRAGSTLLQRMLGSHPEVRAVSEPWLMLHPLYALRPEDHQAQYGTRTAHAALQSFLQELPEREEAYLEGVRRMYGYLYARALAESGKRLFLDKTPRYYYVIPELLRTFPDAHFLILLRNPLAVLCSIVTRWVTWEWTQVYRYRDDLVLGPALLLEGLAALGPQGIMVRYEELVQGPQAQMERICDWLGIEFTPEMIEYGDQDLPRWNLGDTDSIHESTRPMADKLENWLAALGESQMWRLVRDYLEWLGPETIQRLGYSYGELQQTVASRRPARTRLWGTHSLQWLLERPLQERSWAVRSALRVRRGMRRGRKGLEGAVSAGPRGTSESSDRGTRRPPANDALPNSE